ncbi:hypothetical protein [Cupriavidus necator]|uniref:hypothetical protein n=1 Tax=Cupriavidus necator TaxID=106590 RepID=UPI00339D5D03
MERNLVRYSPDMEGFGPTPAAATPDAVREAEAEVLGGSGEMEFAIAALEVSDEPGLRDYLRRLVGHAARAAGRPVPAPVQQALLGLLAQTARRVLPAHVRRTGPAATWQPAPVLRNGTAKTAGRLFGLELEGLSPEDKEFEAARHFVRFAADAVRHAGLLPGKPGSAPRDLAASAMVNAARHHAPGLLGVARGAAPPAIARRQPARDAACAPGACGRWRRQGRYIIVAGC